MTGWREQAACRGVPLDVFYPADTHRRDAWDLAAAWCAICPVRADCATEHDGHGMWGGLSEADELGQRGARRRATPAPVPYEGHGTAAGYRRHYRHGEVPCDPCRTANMLANQDRRDNPQPRKRPPITPEQRAEIAHRRQAGDPVATIAADLGVSLMTVYRRSEAG